MFSCGWPWACGELHMGILRSDGECSAKKASKSRRLGIAGAGLAVLVWSGAPLASPSPVSLENQRTGTSRWGLQNPALSHEMEGYAEAASVEPGDTLGLHVSSASPRYTVEVFRMGWYGGAGARLVPGLRGMFGGERPAPEPRPPVGLVGRHWPGPAPR